MTATRQHLASPLRSAVLAGVAASDGVCCAKLRKRPRAQDHTEAIKLLRTVVPHGEDMAKDLARLLAAKDESHYGVALINRAKARRLLGYARRITELAGQILTT